MSSTRSSRGAVTALALLLAVAAGACGGSAARTDTVAESPAAVVEQAPATEAAPAGVSRSARFDAGVTVRSGPSADAAAVATLAARTPLGSPTTLLVLDERDGWLQVSLPVRPNGSTGWVPRETAEVQTNDLAITVDRARHHLVLTRDGQVEMEAPVADGTATNPTPAGAFYVTDVVETDNAGGAYGPYAFGLSGHSETLSEFGGGDGQLGLHGTNDPRSIGTSVSHGCVRVTNDVIARLVDTVPLGTPVTVI